MKYCLITGATGYIASHTMMEMTDYTIIALDNLSNSNKSILFQIKTPVIFYEANVGNEDVLKEIFSKFEIDFVIHFAGLKSVNESISLPLDYYENNVSQTIVLLKIMQKFNCKKLVFSSSATVYGKQTFPVTEDAITGMGITNPYGMTKYFIERILNDLFTSDPSWSIILLRYFNPISCHPSGTISENISDKPNNLFPYILGTHLGIFPELKVFGNDYNTKDGTCIRDFISVCDLAKGHLAAINKLNETGVHIYNLGTGKGTSVLELITTFENTSGKKLNYTFAERRKGDLDIVYADVSKAERELGWKTEFDIKDMCRHSLIIKFPN